MSDIQLALREACDAVGIHVPKRIAAGVWLHSPVVGKAASNSSGRLLIFDDWGGGVAHNWATGQQVKFRVGQSQDRRTSARPADNRRREREAQERQTAADVSATIVSACRQDVHPYLERKGFADERGLVHDDPRKHFPMSGIGHAMRKAMPEGEGPWLIIPARVGGRIVSVQFIGPDGVKKNILRGAMTGAAHRIATGRETWVCEGIATALTVRAALRLLGRSATVLSAFSASNVATVAGGITGAVIAADHDKPIEQFDGLGTGEFYARRTGLAWTMPPERGDWNDYHLAHGLRAVALKLREVRN